MSKKISLITCVNNDSIYKDNVLKSTESYADRIEYIKINNPSSASRGLNEGLRKASEDIVVCCHQDVFFLDNWVNKMLEQLAMLERWGVCGLGGAYENGLVGCVSGLSMPTYPVQVQTVDGQLIILDKRNGLSFDENLRFFHMYDVDISLEANHRGLGTYVIYAPVIHNTKWASGYGLQEGVDYVKGKWKEIINQQPIYTTIGEY